MKRFTFYCLVLMSLAVCERSLLIKCQRMYWLHFQAQREGCADWAVRHLLFHSLLFLPLCFLLTQILSYNTSHNSPVFLLFSHIKHYLCPKGLSSVKVSHSFCPLAKAHVTRQASFFSFKSPQQVFYLLSSFASWSSQSGTTCILYMIF